VSSKSGILALGAAALLFAVVALQQFLRAQALEEELTEARGGGPGRPEVAAAETDAVREPAEEAARLRKRVEALEAANEALRESAVLEGAPALTAEETAEREPGERRGKTLSDLHEMLKEPEMRELMRKHQRGVVQDTYGPLLDSLGLEGEARQAAFDLLVERQLAMSDLGVAMMDDSLTEAGREELAAKLDAVREDYAARLQNELGAEGFATFERFEESQPERGMLNTVKGKLEARGLELAPETEQALMDTLYEARQGFDFTLDVYDQARAPRAVTREEIEVFVAERRELNAQIREEAAGILTAEELRALETSQEQQLSMQEMGLRMSARMFGEDGGEETRAEP